MVQSAESWAFVDLDESALRELCEGDVDFERDLLETFLACQEEAMSQLASALEAKDYEEIQKVAHFTKGGARSIAAKHLGGMAEGLEYAMSKGCFDEAEDLVFEVQSAYERLKALILNRQAA